jgi:type I restriction enzyme S subunit
MLEEDVVAPGGWSVEPLAACVDVLDSRRKPVNSKERATRPGPVPYYGATGQVGWIDDYLFDEELVLLGEDGAPFLDKSKPIAYVIEGRSWVNNHAHVLRARTHVTSNRYIKHYLDSFDFTHRVQGSTRDKLTQGSMNSIPVLLAPRSLQDELVRTIESVTSRRGSASDHLAGARRAIERFRQAVLAAACSGRLTTDWRDSNPGARSVEHALTELAAGRRKRIGAEEPLDLPMHDLPGSYVLSTVGAAALLVEYGTSQRAEATGAGVPVLRMGNIQDGQLDLGDLKYCPVDKEIERLMLYDGDLLFNRTNSPELVGKSAVFHETEPMTFASYLIRVRFASDVAEPDLVNYWINSAWGRAWARHVKTDGVSQSNINATKLAAMPLPLAPIDEQREIVLRASQLLASAEAILNRVDMAIGSVDRSSQAVLGKVFRGELLGTGTTL